MKFLTFYASKVKIKKEILKIKLFEKENNEIPGFKFYLIFSFSYKPLRLNF